MVPTPPPTHRFVDHTAEAELEVHAASLEDLFAEAGRALAELNLRQDGSSFCSTLGRQDGSSLRAGGGSDEASGRSPESWRNVDLDAPNAEALLVDWLNELVFFADTHGFVAVAFAHLTVDRTHLHADVGGVVVKERGAMVKAATLHGLRVQQVGGSWTANVILDV